MEMPRRLKTLPLFALIVILTTAIALALTFQGQAWADDTLGAPDTKDVTYDERYTDRPGGYTESPDGVVYDLRCGAFSHVAYCNESCETTNTYYFSDGYFVGSADKYNEHLATMSLNLAISAIPAENASMKKGLDGNGNANRSQYAVQLLSDLGFSHISVNDAFLAAPAPDSCGTVLGCKRIALGAQHEEYTVVSLAMRYAPGSAEWAGMFALGTAEEAEGFSNAAQSAFADAVDYVDRMGLDDQLESGKVIFWVTGYSYGGAIANLCAKQLVDTYQPQENAVFAYTFEAPFCGCNEKADGGRDYDCIHNIINSSDPVAKLAPLSMGLCRYGVDHYVPGSTADETEDDTSFAAHATGVEVTEYRDNTPWPVGGTDYQSQKDLMLGQLNIVDSGIQFNDAFSLASASSIKNLADSEEAQTEGFSSDLLTSEATGSVRLDTYLDALIEALLETSCDQRADYTTAFKLKLGEEETLEFASIQDALGTIHAASCEMTAEEKGPVKARLSALPSRLGNDDLQLLLSQAESWSSLDGNAKFEVLRMLWNAARLSLSDGIIVVRPDPVDSRDGDAGSLKAGSPDNLKGSDAGDPDDSNTLDNPDDDLLESFFTTADLVLGLYSYDSSQSAREVFGDSDVSDATATLIGTLLGTQNIGQNHEPDLCLAWLRSFDSLYQNDDDWSTCKPVFVSNVVIEPEAQGITAKGAQIQLEQDTQNSVPSGTSIVLSDNGNQGSILYYKLDGQMFRYNEQPVALEDGTHTLAVHSYSFGRYSEDAAEYTLVVGNAGTYPPQDDGDDPDGDADDPDGDDEGDDEDGDSDDPDGDDGSADGDDREAPETGDSIGYIAGLLCLMVMLSAALCVFSGVQLRRK